MPRSPSPSPDSGPQPKRRRKIWSCTECRRRKVQCDRVLPICGRCVASGKTAHCGYVDDIGSPTTEQSPINGRFGKPNVVEPGAPGPIARISQLESAWSQPRTSAVRTEADAVTLCECSSITVPTSNTRTLSFVNCIPGLRSFMKAAFAKHPALERNHRNLQRLEAQLAQVSKRAQTTSLVPLTSLVPPRDRTDRLVQRFMDTFNSVYHVIYTPAFYDQYNLFWIKNNDIHESFVTILLLVVAIALSSTTAGAGIHGAGYASPREHVTIILQSCEQWLLSKPMTYHSTEDFQITFLLLLAKQLNGRRYKQTWANSGRVVRLFMHAGLDRYSGDSRREAAALVDRELRRRLWIAAVEFELQSAFEQGMMAVPWPQQSDAFPPGNYHDEGLAKTHDALPGDKYTDSSFLVASSSTIVLRHSLNEYLNTLHCNITFCDVKQLTDKISMAVEAIPNWENDRSRLTRALLRINLYQYQLALHQRFLPTTSSPSERLFSEAVLLDTSMKTIDVHRTLYDEPGQSTLDLLSGDLMRAALSICYVYSSNPRSESPLLDSSRVGALQRLDDAIEMMKRKLSRFGVDQRPSWVSIAAKTVMQLKGKQGDADRLMQRAVDEFSSLFGDDFWKELSEKDSFGDCQRDGALQSQTGSTTDDIQPQWQGGVASSQPIGVEMLDSWLFDDWAFAGTNFDLGLMDI